MVVVCEDRLNGLCRFSAEDVGNFASVSASHDKRFVDMGFGATRIDVAACLAATKCPNFPFSFLSEGQLGALKSFSTAKKRHRRRTKRLRVKEYVTELSQTASRPLAPPRA